MRLPFSTSLKVKTNFDFKEVEVQGALISCPAFSRGPCSRGIIMNIKSIHAARNKTYKALKIQVIRPDIRVPILLTQPDAPGVRKMWYFISLVQHFVFWNISTYVFGGD